MSDLSASLLTSISQHSDAVDGPRHTGFGVEVRPQIVNAQQRLRHWATRRLGDSATRLLGYGCGNSGVNSGNGRAT